MDEGSDEDIGRPGRVVCLAVGGESAGMSIRYRRNKRLGSPSLMVAALVLTSCLGGGDEDAVPNLPLRVYKNPYARVDWSSDLRIKAQLHDHHETIPFRIAAYDAAGYDVLTLSGYSGNRSLDYAWDRRRWPPEDWLPADFIAGLQNIDFFLPGAEEVGLTTWHVTSPFMESYIEGWSRSLGAPKQDNQYESLPELLSMIRQRGGVPCIAHPWGTLRDIEIVEPLCVEVYSAFGEYRAALGRDGGFDRNPQLLMLENWDSLLMRNQSVIGVAVNDHFGPYSIDSIPGIPRRIWDSGMIQVLAPESTPQAFKDAFVSGAVLAIKDLGEVKGAFPEIRSISNGGDFLVIDTTDSVQWISNGAVVAEGARLEIAVVPRGARYVRAEVSNPEGSKVYTQAFHLRPVGDVDGDYDVDDVDIRICEEGMRGEKLLPLEQAEACMASGRLLK